MANIKILSKTIEYGIIIQNETSGAATAFIANGNTSVSWNDPAVPATNFRRVAYNAGSVVVDP